MIFLEIIKEIKIHNLTDHKIISILFFIYTISLYVCVLWDIQHTVCESTKNVLC